MVRSTCLLCRELRGLSSDDDLGQLVGILAEPDVQLVSLGEHKLNVTEGLGLVSDIGHRDGVWTTITHTLNGKAATGVRHGCIPGTRRFVDGLDSGAYHFFLGIFHCHFSG